MTDKIDPNKIRPARGLWAAVDSMGNIRIGTIRETKEASRYVSAGWRIVRVDVVPHEEQNHD